MPLSLTLIILLAALLHASWNGLVKSKGDPLLNIAALSAAWLIIIVPTLPFLPTLSIKALPYGAVSVVIHIFYVLFLARSYKFGDLSMVYPIIRGLPPMLVAITGYLFIAEPLSLYGWLGIIIISTGILTLGTQNLTKASRKTLLFSLITACTIAAYTVIDGIGARINGHSTSYLFWFSCVQSIAFLCIVAHIKGHKALITHLKTNWKQGTIGGILSILAYGIILWATTKAPIAYVSALRETSVLFASFIGIVLLKEQLTKHKIVAALLICSGVAIMQLT